jgi:hypothetical protein
MISTISLGKGTTGSSDMNNPHTSLISGASGGSEVSSESLIAHMLAAWAFFAIYSVF